MLSESWAEPKAPRGVRRVASRNPATPAATESGSRAVSARGPRLRRCGRERSWTRVADGPRFEQGESRVRGRAAGRCRRACARSAGRPSRAGSSSGRSRPRPGRAAATPPSRRRVREASARAPRSPPAPSASRPSWAGATGNFGAPPNPPCSPSSAAATRAARVRRTASVGGRTATPPTAAGGAAAARQRLRHPAGGRVHLGRGGSVHASVTASSTCRNAGWPCTGTGGKYVPAKNARPSGVAKTVSGQPSSAVKAEAAAR